MTFSRREFLGRSAAVGAAFAGLKTYFSATAFARPMTPMDGFGPLIPDPHRIIDLPGGFSYRVLTRVGDIMSDGRTTPSQPDGMAAFQGDDGLTIIVRNHENDLGPTRVGPFGKGNSPPDSFDQSFLYDRGSAAPLMGACTTLHYDTKTQTLVRSFLSLAGTMYNCAGGPTPWGSWLSCEEDVSRAGGAFLMDHGYVFEVPSRARGPVRPIPIKAMGRFRHEAVAVDPSSGAVYLSEDRPEGLVYRYLPKVRERLIEGGRLQALAVVDRDGLDTRNWTGSTIGVGERLSVRWIDVDDIDSPGDDLRFRGHAAGAACFARTEGMWHGNGAVYFAATNGGVAKRGQIWRYTPSRAEGTPGEASDRATLELFLQPDDQALMDMVDNITVSPWGDLIACEDSDDETQRLLGVTSAGTPYVLARNALSSSEFAGACFSPDGTTLFVNLQGSGLTLAITGPWRRASAIQGDSQR